MKMIWLKNLFSGLFNDNRALDSDRSLEELGLQRFANCVDGYKESLKGNRVLFCANTNAYSSGFERTFFYKPDREEMPKNCMHNCSEDNCCLAFAFIDLVAFKSLNDRFSHSLGDEILKQFVTACENYINHNTEKLTTTYQIELKLFRHGGDEFTILVFSRRPSDGNCFQKSYHRNLLSIDFLQEFQTVFSGFADEWEKKIWQIDYNFINGKKEEVNCSVTEYIQGASEDMSPPEAGQQRFYLKGLCIRLGVGYILDEAEKNAQNYRKGFEERGVVNKECEICLEPSKMCEDSGWFRLFDYLVLVVNASKKSHAPLFYKDIISTALRDKFPVLEENEVIHIPQGDAIFCLVPINFENLSFKIKSYFNDAVIQDNEKKYAETASSLSWVLYTENMKKHLQERLQQKNSELYIYFLSGTNAALDEK